MSAQKKQTLRRAAPQLELPLLHPGPERGLSMEQARELYQNGYGNRPAASPTKSDARIICEHAFTFFNLIFVVLAGLLWAVGDFRDTLFLLVAVLNTLIGIVQQIRSKRVIDRLALLSAPTVTVVRDGVPAEIPAEELVREDIVELSAGRQIPADGPVVSGQVQVNETLITGEADPVTKNPGDRLLSGSFVVSGRCRARMDQVGTESYAARLTLAAKAEGGRARSEMMDSLDRLIRVVGLALIPMGLALFYNQHIAQGLDVRQSVTAMVAALIGMIPEGLYLLTSAALAVSVLRLARSKTLIHDMNAIETLARVDVLCVDKTGTITSPEMEVRQVVPLDSGLGEKGVEELLAAYCGASEAGNDTAKAVARRFCQKTRWEAESTVPFTSETKWSAVTFRGRGSYALGAPDFILGPGYSALAPRVRPFLEEGCRVLLLARCMGKPRTGTLSGPVAPLALVVLSNPVRAEAPATFDYFAKQGVAVKVISGDDPRTVSRVAGQASVPGAERFVDASALEDGDIPRAVERYTVFGRVSPEQKRKFIRALQKNGHTVAMTGDGINDVLALKDADCGVAMASGSEAACQVAQLVLMDSSFASMPRVVAEGRRVINNIQRSAALFLVKNIVSFLLTLISLFAVIPYPFLPRQLSLVAALTIGIPSFFLALEPNHDLVRGKFMQNVLRRALPGGLAGLAMVAGAELYAFSRPYGTLSTMSTILMGAVGLLVLYRAAKPLNGMRGTLLCTMAAGFAAAVSLLGEFFALSALAPRDVPVLAALLLLAPLVMWAAETAISRAAALLPRRT